MPAKNPLAPIIRRQGRLEHPNGRTDGRWYSNFSGLDLIPAATQAAGNDPDWDLTGTGTVPAPTFLTPGGGRGGILLATRTTSTADNDEAAIFPLAASTWGISVLPTLGRHSILEFYIRTGASIAEASIIAGLKLTDTSVLATDADQAYFLYDTDATTPAGSVTSWVAVISIGGTDTVTTLSTTVAADTEYKLTLDIGIDGKPCFYINNQLKLIGPTALTAAAALKPTVRVATRVDAGGAKTVGIRGIRRQFYV